MRLQCTVPGCPRPAINDRLCTTHYTRRGRSGRLDLLPKLSPVERFWQHTDKNGPTPASHPEYGNCWISDLGLAGNAGSGYPAIKVAGRQVKAHRYAVEQASGSALNAADVVLHTCDVPRCVRNDEAGTYAVGERLLPRWGHLAIGTAADNIADAIAKRRGRRVGHDQRGARNGHARLSEAAVRTIRARCLGGETQTAVARDYGVSSRTVNAIMRGALWRSVR